MCQKCSVNIIARNRWYESSIPVEYWMLSMEKFTGPIELKKAYEYTVNNIATVYDNGWSMCFAGSPGVGKTTTATNILKRAALRNYSCLYTTFSDIVSAMIDAPFEEKYNARKQLLGSDFLVIDELDNKYMGTSFSADLFGRTLDVVFRGRSQNRLCTIFITNSPNIVEAFGGAIKESISSLMGKVKMIVVRGADHRKKANNLV